MSKQPNFFILGVQKCGTTSLAAYCSQHSEIFVPAVKEIGFFDDPKVFAYGAGYLERHYKRCARIKYRCDATPTYFAQHQLTIPAFRRFYKKTEALKFAIILRDPVERFVSHYMHNFTRGSENREINTVATAELHSLSENSSLEDLQYLGPGFYDKLIAIWLNKFSHSQFVFLSSEALLQSKSTELQKLWRFLDLPECLNIAESRRNISGKARFSGISKWVSDESAFGKQLAKKLLPADWRGILRQYIIEKNTSNEGQVPVIRSEVFDQLTDIYSESVKAMTKFTAL